METTETLEHGDYCEVTREQAVELLTIERYDAIDDYLYQFFGRDKIYVNVFMRYYGDEIVLSAYEYSQYDRPLPFADFRQRLINTVNQK